ncbi:hypothetical protein ACF0H5_001737 [Mactra antiquata]
MNLGGNSFNNMTTSHEVYMDIVKIVEELHAAGVKKIFIASIIERGHCPNFTGISSGSFNKMRNAVNRRLKEHFYGNEHAEFIQIGKRLSYSAHMEADLVHPGRDNNGMKIFQHCVRNCFKKCM